MEGFRIHWHTRDFSRKAIHYVIRNQKIFMLVHPQLGNFIYTDGRFTKFPNVNTLVFGVFNDKWIILFDNQNKDLEDVFVYSRKYRSITKFQYQSDKGRWHDYKFFKTLIKMSLLSLKTHKLLK